MPEQTDREVDPRVPLAIERTFLAWVRTGLALMGFGFVVARFGLFLRELEKAQGSLALPSRGFSTAVGTSLIALGVVLTVFSVVQYRSNLASALRGESAIARSSAGPTLFALALCGIGAATIWYLLTV